MAFSSKLNVIICEKKIILPSRKGKNDSLTKCLVEKKKKSRVVSMKLEKGNSRVYSHWKESSNFGNAYGLSKATNIYRKELLQESQI